MLVNPSNDLGLVIRESITDSEVPRAVLGLTPGQKHTLLTEHYKPSKNFMFPQIFNNGIFSA